MKKRQISLVSLILLVPTIFAIIIIFVLGGMWYKTTQERYKNDLKEIESIYVNTVKDYSKYTVDNFIKEIQEDIKYTVRQAEQHDLEILWSIYRRILKESDTNKIKQILLNETFQGNLSYYIFKSDGTCILNPFNRLLKGENLANLKNEDGKPFVKDLLEYSKRYSTGYLLQKWPYNWYFLKSDGIGRDGITLFIDLPNKDWVVVARDDLDQIMYKLKQKWIKQLAIYRYGKHEHGYVFVIQLLPDGGRHCFGIELVNPNDTSSVGRCMDLDRPDAKNFFYRVKYMSDVSRKGYSFVEYYFKLPGTNKYVPKISYVRIFKPWNWLIGTGTYMSDLQPLLEEAQNNMRKQLRNIESLIFLVTVVLIIAVLSAYKLTTNFINKKVNIVFKSFEHALENRRNIDTSSMKIEQVSRLAKNLNKVINKFKLYERGYLESFANILEARDIYTKGHSQRVAKYAKAIAKALGLDETVQDRVYKAGLLHDIGKIGIPDNILLKPGKLSENEYEIIKQHSLISYELLKRIEHLKNLADCIRHHHEKCDGSGYPDGLKCDEISLEARILAIADIFDALTSTRPYRKAFSPKEAIEILKKEKVDQNILRKVEKALIDAFNAAEKTETEFMSEELDEIRSEIFKVDYMTGLLFITAFVQRLRQWIESKDRFALFGVNIKGISTINYQFSTEVGNSVIEAVAKVIKKIEEEAVNKGCEVMGCRAYADIFLVACYPKNDKSMKELTEKLSGANMKQQVIEILSRGGECVFKSKKGVCINEFIGLDVKNIWYPDNGKTAEELVYKIERQLR